MQKIKRLLHFIFNHPLGKKHPLKSLRRFLLWQVQSSAQPDRFFIKRFIGPVKFLARKQLTGITGNIYTGLHEFDDMAFLLHFLRPGDGFFDIGANVGSYTLLASGICRAKSIAIEPVKATFEILGLNIALNLLHENVQLINAAVGAQQGTVSFSADEDTTNHVIAQDESKADIEVIQLVTIDSLLDQLQPDLIKIDVEGYETEVLKGMQQTLANPRLKAIIIELNGCGARYGFDENAIHRQLLDNGFAPYTYDAFTRELQAVNSYGDHNTIYCREIPVIKERLYTAPAFKIMGEHI
ncbi:FkbM family methyltransferase [Mucilaginibacter gynuensis]|uniref:FkbM family methyltransferase n=1 Tax=Mucilaginibacter gynuensis TaxID=1302236 RepID=A0ABP8GQJ9_9SPHI